MHVQRTVLSQTSLNSQKNIYYYINYNLPICYQITSQEYVLFFSSTRTFLQIISLQSTYEHWRLQGGGGARVGARLLLENNFKKSLDGEPFLGLLPPYENF